MKLFRYHYASWFSLLGYYRQAIELVSNENISIKEPDETITIGEEKFYILDVSDYYPYYIGYELLSIFSGFYRNRLRFVISKKILNTLKIIMQIILKMKNIILKQYQMKNMNCSLMEQSYF